MEQEEAFVFACPICHHKCYTYAESQDHLPTHDPTSGEGRLLYFPVCDRICRTLEAGRTHMLTHGPRTWKCHLCKDKIYEIKPSLRDHLGKKHPDQKYDLSKSANDSHKAWEQDVERRRSARRSQPVQSHPRYLLEQWQESQRATIPAQRYQPAQLRSRSPLEQQQENRELTMPTRRYLSVHPGPHSLL